MIDLNEAIPTVPYSAIARGKLRTRSCEEMFLKPHKQKLSETLRYYLKYYFQVGWGNKLQDNPGFDMIPLFAIDCTNNQFFIRTKEMEESGVSSVKYTRSLPPQKCSLRQWKTPHHLSKNEGVHFSSSLNKISRNDMKNFLNISTESLNDNGL